MKDYNSLSIDRLIKLYKSKKLENKYTELCNNIIEYYIQHGTLTTRQRNVLIKQIEFGEDDRITYGTRNEIKNPKGHVLIQLSRIPKNCDECPLIVTECDEDSLWSSSRCMFGCSIWGSSIERPKDCPITVK